MKITELADLLQVKIKIIYFPNQNERWCAAFESCDVKEGSSLLGAWENGKTPSEAVNNYAKAISGKLIVFDAGTKGSREFMCPKLEF